jgi:hypothetical protein
MTLFSCPFLLTFYNHILIFLSSIRIHSCPFFLPLFSLFLSLFFSFFFSIHREKTFTGMSSFFYDTKCKGCSISQLHISQHVHMIPIVVLVLNVPIRESLWSNFPSWCFQWLSVKAWLRCVHLDIQQLH